MTAAGDSFKAIVTAAVLSLALASAAGAASCDRACLKGFADQLLSSMVARDARRLPLAKEYAATENSVPSAPGMMVVWRTATAARGSYFVIDPQSQQVFLITTLSEGPNDTLLFGRLKIQADKLSELELYTNRSRGQGGFQFSANALANFPKEWTLAVASARRASRPELLQAGRSIFDTSVKPPDIAPACVVFENGKVVAENAEVAKSVAPADHAAARKPLASNADGTVPIPCGNPPIRPVDKDARTDIVDEEQGVVVSLAMVHGIVEPYLVTTPTESAFVPNSLLQPFADMLKAQQASGKFSAPALRAMPASQVVAQLLRIYDGKLQGLMMMQSLGATGSRSPWVAR